MRYEITYSKKKRGKGKGHVFSVYAVKTHRMNKSRAGRIRNLDAR